MRLGEVAKRVGGELIGDGGLEIRDVADYSYAAPDHLSCVVSPDRLNQSSNAGALIVPPGVDPGRPGIRSDDPMRAFIRAIEIFRPAASPEPGIHPTAAVAGDVRLGVGVSVGAMASIESGAEVGDRCRIGEGARIGRGVTMGPDCVIHPNCVLYPDVRLGERIVIHAGSVIGSDGFGYLPGGAEGIVKIPQSGTVVIEDDVEVGANVTIDRATLHETRIGKGTKIDNLVQIAHNVVMGEGCLLASQVGLSGTVRLGRGVIMGGQVGVADHVEIGDGARLGAQTGVTKSLEGGKTYLDAPAGEAGEVRRRVAVYMRLPELQRRVAALERKIEEVDR